ncbi:MAG: chorismate mutase [Pseudomonadota bacterium]
MSKPGDTDDPSSLAALRARLDAVDTGLHRLLRERFEIVEEIGAAKGPIDAVIRPAREAAVIENRLTLHKGSLPPVMLTHFWRTLISAACMVQRPFTVNAAGSADVALFLYGPMAVALHESADQAVKALGEHDVAVVPENTRWWGFAETPADEEDRPAAPHLIVRCKTSDGIGALVIGGPGVAKGSGPEAAVLRAGRAAFVATGAIGEDDIVLGRYHPFPIEIPVSRVSDE